MEKKKVLFISQEIAPYLPETEMSVIGRNLPQGIQEKGKEIRAFMPRYGLINERRHQLHEVIRLSGMNLIIDDTDHSLVIKVASIQSARMQVYFIDNEDYFHRKFILKNEKNDFFEDNDERAIFFSRGVLETVKKLRWAPDIVHCHGWLSALVPLYLKKSFKEDPLFNYAKVVYSIYNDEFEKPLNKNFGKKLVIDGITDTELKIVENPTFENLTKLAIEMSDGVIQGSENINSSVLNYLKKSGKPYLGFHDAESYVSAYSDFYDQILVGKFDKVTVNE
jgi:starch synthase